MPDGPPKPDSFTPEEYVQYVLVHIKMSLADEDIIATAKRRKRGINGKPIGISNDNPLLDTRIYEVEMTDGSVE